jgi:hypothetical protein
MVKRTEDQKTKRRELDLKNKRQYEEYYHSHPDENQICTTCRTSKPLSEFMSHFAIRFRCKECHRKIVYKWRKKNPESTVAIYRRSFDKSADYIKSYKLKPCSICHKEYLPCALDFHHPNMSNKLIQVANLYQRDPKRVDREVNICDLICANCHRNETQTLEKFVSTNKNRVKKDPVEDVPITENSEIKTCAKCLKNLSPTI